MNAVSIIASALIMAGIVIMVRNLMQVSVVRRQVAELQVESVSTVRRWLNIHHLMMIAFLVSYVLLLYAVITESHIVNHLVLGAVLLLGALFVSVGVALQTRLLSAIRDNSRQIIQTNAGLESEREELVQTIERLRRESTERKQAEEVLRASEARYRTLFECANDGIFITLRNQFIDVNRRTLEMFGCTREQMFSSKPATFSPASQPDGQPSESKRLEMIDAAINGEPQSFEWRHRRLDGTEFDAEVTLNRMDLGGLVFVLAVVRDITERKSHGDALRASEARYQEMFNSLMEGIGIVDENEIVRFCNPAYARIFDVDTPEELIGRSVLDFIPEDRHDFVLDQTEQRKAYVVSQYDIEIVTAKNVRKTILVFASPRFNDSGKYLGTFGGVLDITERERSKMEQQKLELRLEKAERMRSLAVMAGGVAHDLNNMLGPLVGYPELILKRLPDDSPVRKQVQRLGRAASDAADVIQDLLSLARRGRYEMVPTDLREVVNSYLDSPAFASLSGSNPDVHLETSLGDTPAVVLGSSPHLAKVIMNLIVNAYDAMNEGGALTIEVGQRHLEKLIGGYNKVVPGQYVTLSVADTGTGIASEDVKKIFEPYYSKKEMGRSGSGLGLAVVYGIVKDHNGYYDILSTPGKGTEFVLYFPVSAEDVREAENDVDPGGNESILVVDDAREQLEISSELLSSLGYRVETVTSGQKAIDYLGDHRVDLVILDMIMDKNFDGLDTYREILKLHPGQRAIIVSGYAPTDRVQKVQELGAGPYIRKPYSLSAISRAVRHELDRELQT